MGNEKSYLDRIIGKSVTKTDINTSTIIAIREIEADPVDERMSISIQLYFEDYLLNIYNPIKILPADKQLEDFIGLKLISAEEKKEEIKLVFNNNYSLIVNMREDVYFDPESMTLYGPNNFCAVWN
ncbi:MAG: hypothetical protein JWM28_2000 [Chitinophagaceae bacterium]|nr:hypothetical protein [Chitinophagaceae bacterium]